MNSDALVNSALGASLCFGHAKNHGFRDGNERTAFAASAVFVRLATDAWSEERLAGWLRAHLVPLS